MSVSMHEAVGEMKLTTLTDLSTQGLQQHGWKEAFDDRHAGDILRRALVEQSDEAWSVLQQCFSEFIRKWIRSHPSRNVALLRDSEENYIAQTFSRFWYAVRNQDLEFTTVYAALRYLRATLNGVLTDTLRCHLRLRSREVPLPEPGLSDEACAEEPLESQSLWESIQPLLLNEREGWRCSRSRSGLLVSRMIQQEAMFLSARDRARRGHGRQARRRVRRRGADRARSRARSPTGARARRAGPSARLGKYSPYLPASTVAASTARRQM